MKIRSHIKGQKTEGRNSFFSELEDDIERLTNFKYPAIPASFQEAYSTTKPIETVTKFRSWDPETEWYRNYLKRKVTRLLEVLKPLYKEHRDAQLNQTQMNIKAEVYQARSKRSNAKLIDFLKKILNTFMGVF